MKKIWIGISIVVVVALAFLLLRLLEKEDLQDIKIGAVLPLTGRGAPYGEDALMGIQMAVGELMDKGGLNGKVIQLIVEDDPILPV